MVNIRPRSAWGAQFRVPAGRHVAIRNRRWFVVHWPGSNVGSDIPAVIRAIERSHVRGQGWAVIGYNFLVGPGGTIWTGCGRDVRGIHSPPRNVDGIGVCCLLRPGQAVPDNMRRSVRALYNAMNRASGRTLGRATHSTHWATACAGPALNTWVRNGMPAPGGGGGGGGGGQAAPPSTRAPAFPGRLMINRRPMMRGEDIRRWQARMRQRGWSLAADGWYGPISARTARDFQFNHRLAQDGIVGPITWRATWEAGRPVVANPRRG